MGFTNIKTKNQGFTIVELLIVVVVIAILAAITIVSYNGITNRANASAAKSIASTVEKKAELYVNEASTGNYPLTFSLLSGAASGTSYAISGISHSASAPDSTNGKTTIRYHICGRQNTGTGTVAAPTTTAQVNVLTGIRVEYYDFETPGASTASFYSGQTSGTTTISGVTYTFGCVATAS